MSRQFPVIQNVRDSTQAHSISMSQICMSSSLLVQILAHFKIWYHLFRCNVVRAIVGSESQAEQDGGVRLI